MGKLEEKSRLDNSSEVEVLDISDDEDEECEPNDSTNEPNAKENNLIESPAQEMLRDGSDDETSTKSPTDKVKDQSESFHDEKLEEKSHLDNSSEIEVLDISDTEDDERKPNDRNNLIESPDQEMLKDGSETIVTNESTDQVIAKPVVEKTDHSNQLTEDEKVIEVFDLSDEDEVADKPPGKDEEERRIEEECMSFFKTSKFIVEKPKNETPVKTLTSAREKLLSHKKSGTSAQTTKDSEEID